MALPKDFDVPPIVALKKPSYSRDNPPPLPRGRQKGAKNRIPANVKADVIAGLARHGSNGRGEGGFRGYIYFLAARYPKQASRLIERLLPPSVVITSPEAGATTIGAINIVQVPSGQHLSVEDCVKYSTPAALRLQIEAEAIDSHEAEPESFERDYVEPEPAPEPELPAEPEPDTVMQRARQMGYTPLPPRPRKVG